jgi:hypothetical protein
MGGVDDSVRVSLQPAKDTGLRAVQQVKKVAVPVSEAVVGKTGASGAAKKVFRVVVGVYGPVAVMVSVGVWALDLKR